MSGPPNPPSNRTSTSKSERSNSNKSSSLTPSSPQHKPTSAPAAATTKPTPGSSTAPVPQIPAAITSTSAKPPNTTQTRVSDSKAAAKSSFPSHKSEGEKGLERQRSVVIDEKTKQHQRRSLADIDQENLQHAFTANRRKESISPTPTPPQTPAPSLSTSLRELGAGRSSNVSMSTLPHTSTPQTGLEKAGLTSIREGRTSHQEALAAEARKHKEQEEARRRSEEASKHGGRRSLPPDNHAPLPATKSHDGKTSPASDRRQTPTEIQHVSKDPKAPSSAGIDRSKKPEVHPKGSSNLSEVWPQQDNILLFIPHLEEDGKPTTPAYTSTTAKAPASGKQSSSPAPPLDHHKSTPASASTPKAPNKLPVVQTHPSEPSKVATPSTTPKTPEATKQSTLPTQGRRHSSMKASSFTAKDEGGEETDEEAQHSGCSGTRHRKSVTYDPEGLGPLAQMKPTEGRKKVLVSPPPTPTISMSPSKTLISPILTSPPPTPTDESVKSEMKKEPTRPGILSLAGFNAADETPATPRRPVPPETSEQEDSKDTDVHSRHIQKGIAAHKESQKEIPTARRTSKVEKERSKSLSEPVRRQSTMEGGQHPRVSTVQNHPYDDRRKTAEGGGAVAHPARDEKPYVNKRKSSTAVETKRPTSAEDPPTLDTAPSRSARGSGPMDAPYNLPQISHLPNTTITDYAVPEGTTSYLAAAELASSRLTQEEDELKVSLNAGVATATKVSAEDAEVASGVCKDSDASATATPSPSDSATPAPTMAASAASHTSKAETETETNAPAP